MTTRNITEMITFLKSEEFAHIIKTCVNEETKKLQEEIISLKQEVNNIRDSNINLVKLLDHSKDHTRMEQCTNDWKNTSNHNYNLRNRGMYSQSNTKPIITEDKGVQQKVGSSKNSSENHQIKSSSPANYKQGETAKGMNQIIAKQVNL
ncbi:hypothetical protein JTB14_026760 [Gonioctena quinquepunctata]|nr:hypothetical protein JTB14_026760 [Gonioctena quinquepunctata]